MSGADFAANIAGGVLRFALFIPGAMYQGLVERHWNVIESHLELQGGLYSPDIAMGEKLANRWSRFAMIWTYAVWVPAVFVPAPLSLVFGAVDTVIAGYLALVAHRMTAYSPTSPGACEGTGAHDFQLPTGVNESFFDAAARLNATATSSFQMCATFVQEFQYAASISPVYATIALLNIGSSIYVAVDVFKRSKRDRKPFAKALLRNSACTVQVVGYFLVALLYMLPIVIFRCLPLSFKSPVRFARRYGVKAGQRLVEKGTTRLEEMTRVDEPETPCYPSKGPGKATELAVFLSIYDILILVVQELHYVDLVHLGLVSRSVRSAILPYDAHLQRMVHFKMYSCQGTSKGECWVCKIQVCAGCRHSRLVRQTTPCFHLDNCRPYCTQCYYNTVHKTRVAAPSRAIRPNDPRHCSCAPPTATPNIFQKFVFGSAHYHSRQITLPKIARYVCRRCNALADSSLLEKRLERTKWELKNNKSGPDSHMGIHVDRCSSCRGGLGGGPRWWVCRFCKRECRSSLHGAWQNRRGTGKSLEVEQAV